MCVCIKKHVPLEGYRGSWLPVAGGPQVAGGQGGWGILFLAQLFIHFEFCIMNIINSKINFKEHGIKYNRIL